MLIVDTTFQITLGLYLNPICPAGLVVGAALHAIIACLSMPSSGFCVPALLGAICHPVTVTGKTPTAAFVAGGIKESGKP